MSRFTKPPINEQFKDYGKAPPVTPLSVRPLSSYVAKRLKWLWSRWLPTGEVVVGEGMGGVAKSTLLMDVSARLTTVREMPDGQPHPTGMPVEALWITNEDDPDTQLKPRLVAAGGDPDKVFFVTEDFTLPDDAERLRDILLAHRNVGIVVLDPLFSHVDDAINTGSDTAMRKRVMKLLKNVARECGVVIVVVRHFNKNTGQELALRGSGSYGGIAGAARVVITVLTVPDDDTKERRLIGMTKSNYARLPMPLVFTVKNVRVNITEDDYEDDLPAIEWLGESGIDLDEAMERWQGKAKGGKARQERQHAADADLRAILQHRPLPADDVKAEMTRRGYGKDATTEAAYRLSVVKKKVGMTGGWMWWLPGNGPKDRPAYEATPSSASSASSWTPFPGTFAEGAEDAEEASPYTRSVSSAAGREGRSVAGAGDPVQVWTPAGDDPRFDSAPCPPALYHAHQLGVRRDPDGPGWLCAAGCEYPGDNSTTASDLVLMSDTRGPPAT